MGTFCRQNAPELFEMVQILMQEHSPSLLFLLEMCLVFLFLTTCVDGQILFRFVVSNPWCGTWGGGGIPRCVDLYESMGRVCDWAMRGERSKRSR